jgi:hypothetical protein
VDVEIVYESVFGTTRSVAEAIAEGIRAARPEAEVAVRSVADAPPDVVHRADLLVVGGPTHLRGLSTPSSRRRALRRAVFLRAGGRAGGPGAGETAGVREWLTTLPQVSGAPAAAFDTRLPALLAGGAAPRIARSLERSGHRLLAAPQRFQVTGTEPVLRAGERDRARAWGADLAARLGPAPLR